MPGFTQEPSVTILLLITDRYECFGPGSLLLLLPLQDIGMDKDLNTHKGVICGEGLISYCSVQTKPGSGTEKEASGD